jgi:hypothetical protein
MSPSYVTKRSKTAAALVATLLLAVATAAGAADDPAGRVLQVVGPQSGDQDPQLQEILTSFLSIEIERAGLFPVRPEGAHAPVTGTPAALVALAAGERARYVLIASYLRRGRQIFLDLRWFDGASATVVAQEQRVAAIDLDLDTALGSAAQALLDASGARRDRVTPPPVAAAPAQASSPAATLMPPSIAQAPARQEPFARFVSALNVSGVLVTGYAADYFKYGLMPSFFVGYRVPVGGSVLSAGAGAGYARFLTQGDLADVEIEAIPIAAGARYEVGSEGSLVVYLRAEAGPAVLRVLPASEGALAKVVPFGLAGIGLAIPLNRFIGLTFETCYSVYLESENPIQGFTPAVGSYVRWGR